MLRIIIDQLDKKNLLAVRGFIDERLHKLGTYPDLPKLNCREKKLALDGEKIGSIKALRDRLPATGLRDAKLTVEQFMAGKVIRTRTGPYPAMKRH